MGEYTNRAGLYLPGGGSTGQITPDEVVDIDKLNDNFRKIDALLGAAIVPTTGDYTGSLVGRLVYTEDDQMLHIATSSGLKYPKLPKDAGANVYRGTPSQRADFGDPSKPGPQAVEGDLWVDTDTTVGDDLLVFRYSPKMKTWLGASWISVTPYTKKGSSDLGSSLPSGGYRTRSTTFPTPRYMFYPEPQITLSQRNWDARIAITASPVSQTNFVLLAVNPSASAVSSPGIVDYYATGRVVDTVAY